MKRGATNQAVVCLDLSDPVGLFFNKPKSAKAVQRYLQAKATSAVAQ